jgi:hypothetical protein
LVEQNSRRIVTASLDGTQKAELRRWAEKQKVTQKDLCMRIREQVDAGKGVATRRRGREGPSGLGSSAPGLFFLDARPARR